MKFRKCFLSTERKASGRLSQINWPDLKFALESKNLYSRNFSLRHDEQFLVSISRTDSTVRRDRDTRVCVLHLRVP